MSAENIILKAKENQNGTVELINQKNIDRYLSLKSFFNNEVAIDSCFYENLTGLETSIFEDQTILIECLSFPFTEDDLEIFSEEI